MEKNRLQILKEVYKNVVTANEIYEKTLVPVDEFNGERLHYQYLRNKGFITYQEYDPVQVMITVEGMDFIESVEDIVQDYWSK